VSRFARCIAATLTVALACPAYAGGPPASDAPTEGPQLPSIEDEPELAPQPDTPSDAQPDPACAPESHGCGPEPVEPTPPAAAPTIEPPPPSLQQPIVVRVAVGFSPELDGNKQEKQLLDRLEAGVMASPHPPADVRRLRVGAADAPTICREGIDDLVIRVGYLPDRNEPVLLTRDCRIDEELGVRAAIAADDPALLGVLWAEHNDRLAAGARERKRVRVSPKVRNGLIAGAAVLVIGLAAGFLIAGAVQRDKVVLVISP
jgi:hypothetical protein